MNYRKSILLLMLVICLFSITGVCASEIDNSIVSEDTSQMRLSANDEMSMDNLQSSEENNELALDDNDESVSSQTVTEVLSADDNSTYSQLSHEISQSGYVKLTHKNYVYDNGGSIIISEDNKVIDGNGAVIDMAKSTIRAFTVYASGVTIKNLTIKNANYDGCGGAVYFNQTGTVTNCIFTGNTATSEGGAVYFYETGTVTNCIFTGNTATEDGGAVYFYETGTVTNCIFTGNTATEYGGAIYFNREGTVTNCNFTGNKATGDYSYGGAIFMDSGTVTNCNFTDNEATGSNSWGGAILMYVGNVSYCNFTDNEATGSNSWGGAILMYVGNVSYCNFTDNEATGSNSWGGAIIMSSGSVENCNFSANTATSEGGAVYFQYTGDVRNCNFTDNTATTGSAIYFYSTSAQKSVSNSILLNNRANAEVLEVIKNDNNITITFTGKDNLLNAIYSRNNTEVTFINVTYWGADGIANTGSSATAPSRSNKAAGQNITVCVVVNDKLVLDNVYVTDENGTIVLNIVADDNYYIAARHDTDSYYTEVEKTISNNTKFNVNVTSQTTNNRTVNITAKSNIPNDVVKGKLLFILSNGTEINATYAADGIWWAVHTFDDYGDYQVNASYNGLDNVTIHNATISISKSNSAVNVSDVVLNYGESTNVTVTTEGSTGVTAKINDTTVTVINNYTIPISGLDVGTYTLTVTTIPDANHCEVTRTANITVTKANPEIRMNVTLVADTAIIDVTVPADATGNVTVRIDERVYMENVSYGRALLIVAGLGVGNYTVHVNYNGDKNYASNNNSTKLEVCPIKMDEKDILVADYGNGTVIVVVFKNATGNITVKVGNNTYNSAIVDGMAVFNIDNETPGTHDVDVIYWGDENHEGNSIVSTITVPKYDSPISVDAQSIEYGIPAVIMVYLLENTTGNVSIEIDGVRYSEELIDGVAQFLIENLTAGIKTAYVDYTGDDNYAGKHTTVNITVTKANPEIMMNVTLDGDTAIIDVTAPEDVAKPVVVDVDGVGYYANITGGKGQLVLHSMAGGRYDVTAKYLGDDNYNQSEPQFKSFEICDVPSEVSVKVDNITYGDKAVIEVTVPADATGNVTVTIDGKDYIENVSCANAIFIVAGLGAGNYTVDVTYDGDEKYASSKTSAELEVSKAKTFIKVIDMGNGTVIVVVSDNVSSNVTIKVGNNSYGAAVEDGIAMIDLVNETYGVHDIEVICDGDENHTAAYANASITLNKFKTLIIANAITTTYNVNKDLVISLIDVKGNPISGAKMAVDLNGVKTYTTDKNGQVKVSTKGLAPKAYTAKITFNGNTNYEKSSKNVKVTVKKAAPKLTAKKKTYKTTTKTKKYTIVLKDNVGKAIKKAKVSLKVKGKTYKAKTNSKGKATFKIKNLKKKGTFKAVIKYKGNKYYKKLTKKVKIKVIVKFKTVSRGSKDKATVKEIQQALKDNGYYLTYKGHYLKIDGKFSSCTVRFIKQFQHDKGLKPTGKVDEKTAIKLGILK